MNKNGNGSAKHISELLAERTQQITAADEPAKLHWQQWPADVGRRAPWEIYRVPAKGSMGAIILSGTMTGHDTHYWGGRTLPCLGAHCIACAKGRGKEWHGYFFATGPRMESLMLFEVPSSGAPLLQKWFNEHRSLRGCQFDARRRGAIRNGSVILSSLSQFGDPKKLPKAPSTRDALLRLWQLDRLAGFADDDQTADDLANLPNGDH